MTEKQLIEKLNKLSDIRPSQEWVALTKQNILSNNFENNFAKVSVLSKVSEFFNILNSFKLQTKLAYSFAVMMVAVFGVVGLAQNAVPGDTLFSVRRVTEKVQTAFTDNESSKYNFNTANKRLEDLAVIVKGNKSENMAFAMTEFQASIAEATEKLISAVKKDPKSIKNFAYQVKMINDNAVLLDKIGGSNIQEASGVLYKTIVEEEIKALENSSLTKEQEISLTEIKELFKEEKYLEAFEKILTNN